MSVLKMKSELVKQVPIAWTNADSCLLGVTMPMCLVEGVIGYDFFTNFTLVVDRLGGKMTFVKS